jgi:hypothetical protein
MAHKQMLAEAFAANLEMLKMTLADFSDADMLHRPVAKANHALWQLGHLVNSEVGLVGTCVPGSMPALPEGFGQRFGHDMTSCDDAGKFGFKKQELLDLFARIRQASIQWIKAAKIPELDKPCPEKFQKLVPTLGHLAMLIPAHTAMHTGQMQVIRRALGKPVLF